MNQNRWRIIVGGVLVAMGLLALLNSLFDFDMGGLVWAVLFIGGGLAFLFVLMADRNSWWASFPGFILLSIGLLIATEELLPAVTDEVGGAFVLGGIAISFIVVYLLNRTFWWALIPGGVMTSLTLMLLVEPFMRDAAWIFLLGIAATFGLLTLVPGSQGEKMTWPIYPAGAMLVVALITMFASVSWAGYVWPVLLILVGGFLVIRAMRRS
jgi:hypothetical protein